MTICLDFIGETILVQSRAEGEDGTIGDLVEEVGPGGSFFGKTYDQLRAMGEGTHTLEAVG